MSEVVVDKILNLFSYKSFLFIFGIFFLNVLFYKLFLEVNNKKI